jgi:DNA replication and repair protein RecF
VSAVDAVLTGRSGDHDDVASLKERLLEAMENVESKEIERGVNLVGPHRDDIRLEIGSLPARGYASHGESWSLALALKLAAFSTLDSLNGGPAVLILDDVFAELDVSRRSALVSMIGGADQVIVTGAVGEDVPIELKAAQYDVMGGKVTRVKR